MKKEDILVKELKKNEKVRKELVDEFSRNRVIIYLGIGLVGFIFALIPFLITRLTGAILIIFAIILYFSDKKFV